MNAVLREALAHLDRGFAVLPVRPDKTPASDLIRRTRGTPRLAPAREDAGHRDRGLRLVRARPDDRRRRAHRRSLERRRRRRGRPGARAEPADDRDRHDATRLPRATSAPNGPVRTREYPWGEIRGEGAYVVAPCTRRADGGAYAWELTPEDAGIADFAAFENSAAAPLHTYYLFQTFYLFGPRASRVSEHSPTSSVTSTSLSVSHALSALPRTSSSVARSLA